MEVSMEAAAVLLSLAMRDTETPVSQLCDALKRIAHAAPVTNGANLANDVAVCIQSLQFHDRLIQQLAAVRGLLASVVNAGPLDVSGFGAHRWEPASSMSPASAICRPKKAASSCSDPLSADMPSCVHGMVPAPSCCRRGDAEIPSLHGAL
jgi:hypothetical protein